jgi:hypothetical protein
MIGKFVRIRVKPGIYEVVDTGFGLKSEYDFTHYCIVSDSRGNLHGRDIEDLILTNLSNFPDGDFREKDKKSSHL